MGWLAQGRIPYRLHTQRYPYCRQQCPTSLAPRGCSLLGLTPANLLRTLAGRRLVLWGDSVSRMHHDFLVRVLLRGCPQRRAQFAPRERRRSRLGSGPMQGYKLQIGPGGATVLTKARACRPLPAEERGAPTCVRVRSCGADRASAPAEICYVHSFKEVLGPDSQGCLAHLKPRDVVLFNTGLHYQPHERGSYAQSIGALSSAWAALRAQQGRTAPVAIWRETSPQVWHAAAAERGL